MPKTHPTCKLAGFWESSEDYLYVQPPEGLGKPCSHVSSVAELRGDNWTVVEERSSPNSNLVIDVKNKHNYPVAKIYGNGIGDTIGSIRVESPRESLTMHRPTRRGETLFESVHTYVGAEGGPIIIFSDGGLMIKDVYLKVFFAIALVFIVANFFPSSDLGGFFFLVGVFLGLWLVLFVPMLLVCAMKWAVYGWWDAVLAGRVYIYTLILLPAIPLFFLMVYLVKKIKGFKASAVGDYSGYPRKLFFYFFLLVDVVSLVSTLAMFAKVFSG